MQIRGKRILLVCENFYGYDIAIKNELLKLGAKTVYLKGVKFFCSSLREIEKFRLHKFLMNPFERRKCTKDFCKEIDGMTFDVFFCIENTWFSKFLFEVLRKENPQIKCVLFLWDTYKTQQGGFKDYRFLFDKVYSFDKLDCNRYGMTYYPDFYIEPINLYCEQEYDIAFVGTANSSSTYFRIELLHKIKDICDKNGLKYYFHLKYIEQSQKRFSRKTKYQKQIECFLPEKYLKNYPISLDEYDKILSKTRIVLDLNHRNRQGMTINAVTALALGKKLITTNKYIVEEDFYTPNNIMIIDELNPEIDINFFYTEYCPTSMKHLRLDNWLINLFDKI